MCAPITIASLTLLERRRWADVRLCAGYAPAVQITNGAFGFRLCLLWPARLPLARTRRNGNVRCFERRRL